MTTTTNGMLSNGKRDDVLSSLLTPTLHRTADTEMLSSSYQNMSLDLSDYTPDVHTLIGENRGLKHRLRQLQEEYQAEQDVVYTLRKKLNNLEKDKLEMVSKANSEVSHLDGEVTKLRAQLERGEAVRQNLEYELAKARKDISLEKRSAGERENLMTDVNESMKQKIAELSAQIETLCEELERTKHQGETEASRLRNIVEDKDKFISEYRSEKDVQESELDRLQAVVTQKDVVINGLEDTIQKLEGKEHQGSEAVRQKSAEMELIKDKEERLKKDYESVLARVRSLEESIEAERAAHLESKFNSEIVQLRTRDLESALELEKTSKTEALTNLEKLNKQLRELQQLYDDERRNGIQSREKLENAEKEYAALNKRLHHELEDKRMVIQKLSGQLDVHQKNFDELKQELNKAKKRQLYLEDSYTGSSKEIEILLDNFCFDHHARSTTAATNKKKAASKKKEGNKSLSLSMLMEELRHLLIDYRRRLDDTNADVTRLKAQNEQLAKECQQFKDVMWAKDKALESTQQGMSKTNKELRKSQNSQHELESLVKQLKGDLDTSQRALQKEKHINKTLTEQVSKVSTKWKTGEQVSMEFLQALYQQLLGAQRTNKQPGSTDKPSNYPPPGEVTCWTDLALYINDQVATLLTDLHRAEEKIIKLETSLTTKDRQLEGIQQSQDEQLDKLGSVMESRTHEWQQQKSEMEKHYTQLLAEIHARQKKTQALADQAWEKVRVTGSVQQGLESECTQLRRQLDQTQKEHDTLLATCALLCGSLYPMYARYTAMASQRNFLVEQLTNFQAFKKEVQVFVEALSLEDTTNDRVSHTGRGILRFRKAVIAVMMANRLINSNQGHCKLFSAHDVLPGVYSTIVCSGFVEPITRNFAGLANPWIDDAILQQGQHVALAWLSSGDLLSTILATMSELQGALHKAKQGDSKLDSRQLVNISRNCFQKLLCHLPSMFASIQPAELLTSKRDKNSLVRQLGHGLNKAMGSMHLKTAGDLSSSQVILSALQHHVLEFTQRLHMAEVERRDLRAEIGSLRQGHETWEQSTGALGKAEKELIALRKQVDDTVARGQFESVCEELNNALRREQQMQHLLNEQAQQIHQLSIRLNVQISEDSEKEHTLAQAVQGLTEGKMELKRQDQRYRQQYKQLSMMEDEKRTLLEKVKDAENALKTAAKDRECVTNYLKSVEKALESVTSQLALSGVMGHTADYAPLLSTDHIPTQLGKPGSDFTASQRLVSAFVECLKQLNGNVNALLREIQSHQEHINTLKEELSAACRREYEDEFEKMKLDEFPFMEDNIQTAVSADNDEIDVIPTRKVIGSQSQDVDFQPLREDTSDSYTSADNHKKSRKQPSKIPCAKSRPKKYHTPQRASRRSLSHRKPTEGKA